MSFDTSIMATKYCFLLATIAFTAYTQLVTKWQLVLHGDVPAGWINQLQYYIVFLRNPWIISCFLAVLLMAFSWVMTLSEMPLNYAYPVYLSSVLVIISVSSFFLFGESLPYHRLVGIGVIICGLVIGFGRQ